jgi:inner membrane protein
MENSALKPLISLKYSVTLKLIIIAFLGLLLLIPAALIQSTIEERSILNDEAIKEIGSKWAESQEIVGPILTIPITYETEKDGKTTRTTEDYHILPHQLNIEGKVHPEILKRGIFKGVVYRSDLIINGNFTVLDDFDKKDFVEFNHGEAKISFGITDLRGIEDEVEFTVNSEKKQVNPGTGNFKMIPSGFSISMANHEFKAGESIPFTINLKLKGSKNLSFIPTGKTTNVKIQSPWTAPKFDGKFLPNNRNLTDNGFSAEWKILELNRNFPQSWTNNAYAENLKSASFGVDLLSPMEDYQKSTRSAKYALMTIALTFLMFFLVEILGKKNIHPFQYAMVGFAICLFYILLVSISEQTSFNFAYLISTIAVVGTICLYSLSLFRVKKYTLILATVLLGSFGFLFVTLQMEDYALLMGSIGLFIILATTMYITRNIDWNRIGTFKNE